jgi:hypothetical protein
MIKQKELEPSDDELGWGFDLWLKEHGHKLNFYYWILMWIDKNKKNKV